MAKILLVESDLTLAATLKRLFQLDGHQLRHAVSLKRSYELLSQINVDLLIVDRLLPDGDGFELVSFINGISPSTRFIFCSEKARLQDRLEGLSLGADDYVSKPFNLEELRLKVTKLLLMEKHQSYSYIQAGQLTLYPDTGALLVADRPRQLRRREAEILSCLLRFRGRVVSRQMLIERVWKTQKQVPTFTTLDVYIRRIRIMLGAQAHLLKTVRGYGYMISCSEIRAASGK